MARLTLLQMTQDILSEMGSDEINSIGDSAESLQVATIVKNKFYDIVARDNLPEQDQLFDLQPSLDVTKPVQMIIPDNVSKIYWLKYFDTNPADSQQQDQFGAFSHGVNTDLQPTISWTVTSTSTNTIAVGAATFTVASGNTNIIVGQVATASSGTNTMSGTVSSYSGTTLILAITSTTGSGTFSAWSITGSGPVLSPIYKYVTILPIEQFLDIVNGFNLNDSDVRSFVFNEDGNNFTFYYKNDHQPQYCTIISNKYVVFDMYDGTQDSTLQGSKTMCFGRIAPPFLMQDSFIPDIQDNKFPLLFNEAKALAFFVLKQMPHSKAEQELKRQWTTVIKDKSITNKPSYFDQLNNYGRMPRTGGYGGFAYGPRFWNFPR